MDNQAFLEVIERMATSFDRLATGMIRLADIQAREHAIRYPEKKAVEDAKITHRQTEEEKLREAQGATDETDEEWTGRREKAFIERRSKARKARRP
jgi:hypothetical protein